MFHLLFRELWFRKLHFFLSFVAVTVAAALVVAAPILMEGHRRHTDDRVRALEETTKARAAELKDEARKLMRDMGFNLKILHKDTKETAYYAGDQRVDMPLDYVSRLAGAKEITLVTHIVATLQEKVEWKGAEVLLVGYLPEATQSHKKKKAPMGYNVDAGTVYLGHSLAALSGTKVGDKIEVRGRSFVVARILREQGSKEDVTIAMRLDDAQKVLDKPGKINEILALGCRCSGDRLPKVRQQLEVVLPETRITEVRSMALARDKMRAEVEEKGNAEVADVTAHAADLERTMGTLISVTVPLVVLTCAIWIGLLVLANVRERKMEIGVLRALGVGSLKIATLFIGKAIALGVAGAAAGFAVGTWLAGAIGRTALEVDAHYFGPSLDVLFVVLIGAPLVCAMASYLPTLVAVVQDPAIVLRED